MPEPLTIEKPYPTTEGLCPDAYSLRIVSPAYASSSGELNAVLQYIYQSFFFEREGFSDIAETLVSIAVAEMIHLSLLGKTILSLGASPVYCQFPSSGFNFYSTKYVSYSCSLAHMLEDDVLGERRSVAQYERMLRQLKNGEVSAIVRRIAEDEKLHLDRLTAILSEFKG